MKKTIFKRPLFVNPQAYTVIPELYSVNKLLSFNFDENDTYTTKLVYNGRVESIIKKAGEEHILHLDLYTVDGSCVLGEWYVKGIDSESVVTIDKNILTIVANNNLKYPGLIAAWSAKGKTNEDVDRNILKDLTGNGHDITLNNFAYSGMSGYGGYNYIGFLLPWMKGDINIIDINRNNNYFTLTFSKVTKSSFLWCDNFLFRNALKLKVSGLSEDVGIYIVYGSNRQNLINGENIILFDNLDNEFLAFRTSTLFKNANVRVELIPEYPDALVFDGVDDGGVAEINEPKLANGYTFIIEREIIKFSTYSCVALFQEGNDAFSPFGIEQLFNRTYYTWNYDSGTNIHNIIKLEKSISYQTDKIYNNFIINKGSIPIRSKFNIGSWSNRRCVNMAFYSAYLFNRTLTDEEIKSFIRKHIDPEYLLPSEIVPTPPPPQQGELKYWLCGEDAPVNNKWIDRIDNRMQWNLVGSSIYNQEDKYYEFGGLIGKHAFINDTNNIFNCGDKFEIEIDFECLPVPDNVQNTAILLDIGSVTMTNKNFGFDITKNKITTNYKMFGDSTNSKYGISSTQLNNTTIIKKSRQTIYMGVEKYSDTQNIVYVKDSFGNKVYAPNPHTPINHSNFSIKQYLIGDGLLPGYSFNTVKIYNIKVYVKSYKETMNFIIIPLADAAEVFTNDELEAARKSIDGKEVIVHEEILLQKKVERGLMTLPTDGEPVVWTYPVYEYNSNELNELLNSNKWYENDELVSKL